ncbi:MAG: hypothetical protein ACFCUS_13605 [Rubrimonas sp.]|uniref:hypothetical protein n=1 Tax=Rubrimonas sp. TaxID=2036015 RepID=UPI002FDCDD2C
MDERARRLKRRGGIALGVAAVMISALGLAGPLMLATTGDPEPVLAWYPLGWAVAIGAILVWLRSWRASHRG